MWRKFVVVVDGESGKAAFDGGGAVEGGQQMSVFIA